MKIPLEIKIDDNKEKIFYLEEGEYYLGRTDVEYYRSIKEKFGEGDDYKFAIYLFKKNELGYLDIKGIVSKDKYVGINRYHFKITVNNSGDVLVSIGDYRSEKPTYNAVYLGTTSVFDEEKLAIDRYLDLVVSGCSETGTVKIRLGLVSPIDIIGPEGFNGKGEVLKYRIRTKIKEIMKENKYPKSLYERIKCIVIGAYHVDGSIIKIDERESSPIKIIKPDDDVNVLLHINKEKEFYFECSLIKESKLISLKKSKYVCPYKYTDKNTVKIFSISLNDLIKKLFN